MIHEARGNELGTREQDVNGIAATHQLCGGDQAVPKATISCCAFTQWELTDWPFNTQKRSASFEDQIPR